jgi:hypothetical protein
MGALAARGHSKFVGLCLKLICNLIIAMAPVQEAIPAVGVFDLNSSVGTPGPVTVLETSQQDYVTAGIMMMLPFSYDSYHRAIDLALRTPGGLLNREPFVPHVLRSATSRRNVITSVTPA